MNTIVSFETAKWLESIGFPQNNLKGGYATDIYEVCVPSENDGHSQYHDTFVGELVNKEHISFKKNEKDLIAAPTLEDAFNFIKKLNFLNFFEAATGLNEIYFRVCKCEYVIIHETIPADSYDEALKNLLEDKSVHDALKAWFDMFK